MKKKPVKGPAEKDDINLLTNAASPGECTGLIQVPPQSHQEYEAYNQVYSFTLNESESCSPSQP